MDDNVVYLNPDYMENVKHDNEGEYGNKGNDKVLDKVKIYQLNDITIDNV